MILKNAHYTMRCVKHLLTVFVCVKHPFGLGLSSACLTFIVFIKKSRCSSAGCFWLAPRFESGCSLLLRLAMSFVLSVPEVSLGLVFYLTESVSYNKRRIARPQFQASTERSSGFHLEKEVVPSSLDLPSSSVGCNALQFYSIRILFFTK